MRPMIMGRFIGPFVYDIQPLDGVLVITPAKALWGLSRQKEGWEDVQTEIVDHVADYAVKLMVAPDLGTQVQTLTGQLEQVRDLKAWAADLLRAATSTEVVLEDRREALVKVLVTAVRTTANREDPGLMAAFEKTLRYYGQHGKRAANTRAKNAAAKAAAKAAAAEAAAVKAAAAAEVAAAKAAAAKVAAAEAAAAEAADAADPGPDSKAA